MISLYRYFDGDDVLLYVGISVNAMVRLTKHRVNANWFDDIRTVKIEKFDDRFQALIAEANAIRNELPIYNIACNRTSGNDCKSKGESVLLTVTDVARRLKVTRKTVYNMMGSNRLPKPMDDIKPPRWHAAKFFAWQNG